jgi:polygalacturonase
MSHMPAVDTTLLTTATTVAVNVMNYGARGDASTDDTAAIQRAINAGTNVDLLFPPDRTYIVSSPLTKNSGRLRIFGYGATLKLKSTFPAYAEQTGVIYARNLDECSVFGLTLDGNSTALNGGAGFPDWTNFIEMVFIYGTTVARIRDCYIKNFPSIGINVTLCDQVRIDGNRVEDGMLHPIYVGRCTNVSVLRNIVVGRGDVGTNTLIGGIGIHPDRCDYIDVSENHISNTSDTAIKGQGCDYVNCERNTVEDAGKDGIKWMGFSGDVQCKFVRVAHNAVNRINAWRVDGSSLIIVSDCQGAYVGGNQVRSGGTRVADAIRVNVFTSGAVAERYIIEGNLGESIDGQGITMTNINNATVRGNRIDAPIVADQCTGDWVVDGNVIHNNGTIDSSVAGISILRIQSGSLVASNNIVSDYQAGIKAYADGGAALEAISMTDNIVKNCHNYGLRVDNVSSAGTIGVLTMDGNTMRNTCAGASSTGAVRIGIDALTIAIAKITNNTIHNTTANTISTWLELNGSATDKIALLDISGVRTTGVASARSITNPTFATHIVGDYDVAPAQITANQNNYTPQGMADVVLLTSDAARDITGFGGTLVHPRLWVYNVGSFNITLKHQSASSTGSFRVIGRGGADVVLTPNTGACLVYAITQSRWVVMTDTL